MLNTSEAIRQINETNDYKQNLGDGGKMVQRQEKNGVDLLCPPELSESIAFENFEKLNPGNFTDEMTEYENAINNIERQRILEKYKDIAHEINQPIQNRPSGFAYSDKKISTIVPELNYEVMYEDKVCTFFIGSVTAVGLYIIYKMME